MMSSKRVCSFVILLVSLLPAIAALGNTSVPVMQLDATGAVIKPGFPVPSCNKLVLFKTHKTGSTTLHSIVTRLAAFKHLRISGAESSNDHYVNVTKVNSKGVEHSGDVAARHLHAYLSMTEAMEAWSRLLASKAFTLIVPIRDTISHFLSHKAFYHRDETWESYVSDQGCRSRGEPPPRHHTDIWGNCWNPLARGDFRLWRGDVLDAFLASLIFKRMLFVPVDRMDEVVLALGEICDVPLSQLYFTASNVRSAKRKAWRNPRSFEDLPNHESMDPALIEKVFDHTELDRKLVAHALDKLDADMSYLDAIQPVLHRKKWLLEELRRRIWGDCADPPLDASGRLDVAPYSSLQWPADDVHEEFKRMCHFLHKPGAADIELEHMYSWAETENFVPTPFNTTLYEEYFLRLENEAWHI